MKAPRLWITIVLPVALVLLVAWLWGPAIPDYAVGDSVIFPDNPALAFRVSERKLGWDFDSHYIPRVRWLYYLKGDKGQTSVAQANSIAVAK